jgi:hypothetical protein
MSSKNQKRVLLHGKANFLCKCRQRETINNDGSDPTSCMHEPGKADKHLSCFDACSKGGTGGDEDRLVDTTTTHRTEPYLSPGK